MRRLKRFLIILSVNCLVAVVGLVVLELSFGGWLGTDRLNRLNLLKDLVRHYDVSHLYSDPQPVIQYSRDKYGLRGTYANPGEINILTVGGSTTDQRYIRDGETWQDVLQAKFWHDGRQLIVANAGVDGQSTYGHIKNFEWWFPNIPDLTPEYVLFYVGLNDFYKETGYKYDQLVPADQGFSLKREIKENSALWYLIRTLRGIYRAMVVVKIGHRSVDFSMVRWTRDELQSDYGFMERRLGEYADRLRRLVALTRQFGAEPIFVSQPARTYRISPDGPVGDSGTSSYDGHQYNGVDYYHMMRKLDGVTKEVAKEQGALFIDLAQLGGWTDADFYDFVHMTPQGEKKVGDFLHDALSKALTNSE